MLFEGETKFKRRTMEPVNSLNCREGITSTHIFTCQQHGSKYIVQGYIDQSHSTSHIDIISTP